MMKAREGDLVENLDGCIFDVKGLVHPPRRIVAFVRYFPSNRGERSRGGINFRKVYSLSNRFAFLERKFPRYVVFDQVFGETLCEVPVEDVKVLYKPYVKLQELRKTDVLDALQGKCLQLAELLKTDTDVDWSSLGVSGSVLVGLQGVKSDIDLLVYGSNSCHRVYKALGDLVGTDGRLNRYGADDLRALFDFRSKDTSVRFDDFVRTESRKLLQGTFMGVDYFIRFVKGWDEIGEKYGDILYECVGHAGIRAKVVDDSESIFTPCRYKVADVQVLDGSKVSSSVSYVVSFRGRFCEQARNGEVIAAQGKVEYVLNKVKGSEHVRLLLGNKPSDYMILA